LRVTRHTKTIKMESYHRIIFALLVFFLTGLNVFAQTEKPLTDWERKEYKKDLEQNKREREKYGRGLTDRQLVDWMERMKKEGEESDRWWEKYYAEREKECSGHFIPEQFEDWDDFTAVMCGTVRTQQDAIIRPRFSYAENYLMEAAGIDPDNTTSAEIREKMEKFFLEKHRCLECSIPSPPFHYGNYLIQLHQGNYLRQFQTFLRGYKFPVNIIDRIQECTILDFNYAQVRRTTFSSENIHNYMYEVRKLILREGARYVHELEGICPCGSCEQTNYTDYNEKVKDGSYIEYFTYSEVKPGYEGKSYLPDEERLNYTEILYEKGQYKNGKRFGEWTFYHPFEKNKYFVLSYDDNGEVIRYSFKDYK